MNKVMVEVFLPAVGKSYDLNIPKHLSVGMVVQMLCCIFSEMQVGEYIPSSTSILFDSETGDILDYQVSIDSLSLTTGKKLMLK